MAYIEFRLYPRQHGKTKLLLEKALRLYENDKKFLFISPNTTGNEMTKMKFQENLWRKNKMYFKDEKNVNELFLTIDSVFQLNQHELFNKNVKHIFIDEYLYYSNRNQAWLYNSLAHTDNKIYISTSPREMFDRQLFELVKTIKRENIRLYDFLTFTDIKMKEQYVYLYNNFLTDINTELCYWYDYQKKNYGKENFDLEVLGKIFKDEE